MLAMPNIWYFKIWSILFWSFGIFFSSPVLSLFTISLKNTPVLQVGSRNFAFSSIQISLGRISNNLLTVEGGVKTSSLLRLAKQFKIKKESYKKWNSKRAFLIWSQRKHTCHQNKQDTFQNMAQTLCQLPVVSTLEPPPNQELETWLDINKTQLDLTLILPMEPHSVFQRDKLNQIQAHSDLRTPELFKSQNVSIHFQDWDFSNLAVRSQISIFAKNSFSQLLILNFIYSLKIQQRWS